MDQPEQGLETVEVPLILRIERNHIEEPRAQDLGKVIAQWRVAAIETRQVLRGAVIHDSMRVQDSRTWPLLALKNDRRSQEESE